MDMYYLQGGVALTEKPVRKCDNVYVRICRRKCCRKAKDSNPDNTVQAKIDWSGLSPREQLLHWRNSITGNDEKS